jgi:hypothetical protein
MILSVFTYRMLYVQLCNLDPIYHASDLLNWYCILLLFSCAVLVFLYPAVVQLCSAGIMHIAVVQLHCASIIWLAVVVQLCCASIYYVLLL